MEIKLPPIASKEEIQNYISNIRLFAIQSESYQIAKDIFAPIQFTVSIYSLSKTQNEQEPLIMKLKTIQSLISFFAQCQNPIDQEISLNDLGDIINIISTGSFGLKMYFSVYTRSLSLMIKYILSNEVPGSDRSSRNLAQKAIDSINSLPIKSLFYPESYQHPFIDFEILNYNLSSPTAICVSNEFIYTCSDSGIITRYGKYGFHSITRNFYTLANNFGLCSMLCVNDKLYFINNSQKCLIVDFQGNIQSPSNSPSNLTYPSISDGCYIYSIIFNKKPKIRVFDSKLDKVKNIIQLQVPETVTLNNSMPMSTNGSFINFVDNEKCSCHIFSILNGRYICSQKVSFPLQAVTYDFTFNGFVCLSVNGLVEISSKATVTPWSLNYQSKKAENNGYGYKENFLECLGMIAMHYVGGGYDIPLSMFDDSCITSLKSLLNFLINSNEGELNENSLISALSITQVKLRRFDQQPSGIDQILIQIFSEQRFMFARRAAAFLFLSCLSLFEKNWTKKCTDLLRLIVIDRNCSDLVFSFLTLFSFDVPYLDETVLQSILNLMANSSKNMMSKSVIILSTIQEQLISKLPESESLFTSYVTNLMLKMTESWTSYLSSGNSNILSCFVIVKVLLMQIMKNINRINLPLIVTERLFAVSIMQPLGNDTDEQGVKTQEIFNALLFFALHFAFKRLETTEFIQCSQKVDKNHSQISMDEFQEIDNDNRREIELLVKCANDSNWSSKSEVIHFLNEMKGKVTNLKELEKRIDQLHSIQPQPLRKIFHFLTTGEFKVVKHQDSAIFQLMNYAQWIPSSFNRLIFATFLGKIEEFQDDFLCIPRSILKPFVLSSSVTILLPLSIIKFSKVKLKESQLDFRDLQCSYDKISTYIMKEQSDEFIQPLLNLKTNMASNRRNVQKAMISAIIGFRKSDMKTVNDEIIQKLIYCRKAVSSKKMVKLLIEIVRIFALKGDRSIFNFIVEIVGGCILKKSDIFPNAKNNRSMFQFAFEFVELSRELVSTSSEFRLFLASSEILGNPDEEINKHSHSTLDWNDIQVIRKLAFMSIINNTIAFPVVGCTFTAIDYKKDKIESVITEISKNGHKITLGNGNTYDIRNLFQYNVTSPHQINTELFDDDQIERVVNFFNIFHKYFKLNKSIMKTITYSELALNLKPLVSILYFTSLQCLSFNAKFVTNFHGIYFLSAFMEPTSSTCDIIDGDKLIVVEPINDKTVFRRFWEFYSQPQTLNFSVFESDGGYSTSPISPTTHFSVRFRFSGLCEAILYCCFQNTHSLSEMPDSCDESNVESFVFQELNDQALVYHTVTFSEYFDFVFDPDSQQVSLISPYKTVNYPIFNSALFYSIFLKVKNLTFEMRNEQWLLDRLNSFQSYDFSSFKLSRFNHMITVPCKSFEDSFLNELAIIVRNMCMKTIVPNMLKVKPIDSSLCVSWMSSMLSNFDELFQNSNTKLRTRIEGNIEINSNFDIPRMTEIFMMCAKNSLMSPASYVIWNNNSYAKPAKKGTIVCNCVIFAPGVIRVADRKTEVEMDCFILPKEHLNRTVIELLMFSKNALIFCKETHNEEAFQKVVEIMRKCQKEKIPGFTDTDLKSVDTIIQEVEELCGS